MYRLTGYKDAEPVFVDLCLGCADKTAAGVSTSGAGTRRRMSVGSLMVVLGLCLCFVCLVADQIGIGGSPGHGSFQIAGLVIGGLILVVALIFRIDMLGVFGVVVLALSEFADVLRLWGNEGFGWKQQLALWAGVGLMLTGLVIRMSGLSGRNRRVSSDDESPAGESLQ